MERKERMRFSVKAKMYVFVIITVLAVAAGTSAVAFRVEADQIDRYYKQNTADNARNFASFVDGDFLAELKEAAASDEFQALRVKAEEEEDEKLIEDWLTEKGLWERYAQTRAMLNQYLENMDQIKYLYIVAHGDADSEYDMYLIDDYENPLYETGYYEEREEEFLETDLTKMIEPQISHGDWGWLCSSFAPVFGSDGNAVCIVGCDVGMDDVVAERGRLLLYLFIGTLIFVTIVLTGAMLFINEVVVKPLDAMTREMKKFRPSDQLSHEEAGVINVSIKSNDELSEIYQGIRTMQINTLNYLRDLSTLQKDKIKAEIDIKNKDKEIDKLNVETYKDALTGVGNKAAYVKMAEELNRKLKNAPLEFAIVMVDMNNLKQINDEHGHKAGDQYIKGCCHLICEAFKHSPIYRIGGDEFVALLQGPDYDKRKEITEALKGEYAKSFAREELDPWLRYSAAVGLAEHASDDATVEFVFKRADKAMYEDKEKFKAEHGRYR